MATAICGQCGDVLHWSAQRGVRLADFTCKCGSKYQRAEWNSETQQWQQPRPTHIKRGKAVECCLCGKKRFPNKGSAIEITEPQSVTLRQCFILQNHYELKIVIESGQWICWWHRSPVFTERTLLNFHLCEELDWREFACIAEVNQ
jgi:hypothetical protein